MSVPHALLSQLKCNHWHFVLQHTEDGGMIGFMCWSQNDDHFFVVARDVGRNALRSAKRVASRLLLNLPKIGVGDRLALEIFVPMAGAAGD